MVTNDRSPEQNCSFVIAMMEQSEGDHHSLRSVNSFKSTVKQPDADVGGEGLRMLQRLSNLTCGSISIFPCHEIREGGKAADKQKTTDAARLWLPTHQGVRPTVFCTL